MKHSAHVKGLQKMTELHLLYVVIVQAHVIPQIALEVVVVAALVHVVVIAVNHVTKQIAKMGVLVGVLSSVLQIVRMAAMVIAVMDVTIGAMEAAN